MKNIHLDRYNKFIKSRKKRSLNDDVYTENHHIVPRSLGGSNEKENLIKLTGREHFIAHFILWKAYGGKMAIAFWRMVHSNQNGFKNKLTSYQYEQLRIDHSIAQSKLMKGRTVSKETRIKISKIRKGIPHTKETRSRLSEIQKTKIGKNSPHYGKKHSKETKKKCHL